MSESPSNEARLFTVDQANATLPLVSAITADVVNLTRELVERGDRLDLLKSRREPDVEDIYSEELGEIENELHNDAARLREYVDELADLGVELKSAGMGLVDFPTIIDEQPAYLCWQLGEAEVLYWHSREGGYENRQPLTAGATIGDAATDGFDQDA
jgi:hypothetical protein